MTSDFNYSKEGFHVENGVLVKFNPDKYYAIHNSVRSIVIPEGVTEIGYNAFRQCEYGDNDDDFCGVQGLVEVTLPSTCTVLRGGALFSCRDLHKVKFLAKLELIESAAFSDCPNLTDFVDIPKTQNTIPSFLYNEGGLYKVDIPEHIKIIEEAAFYDDVNLEEVNFNKVEVIEEDAFFKCSFSKGITLPSTVKEVKSNAFGWTRPPFIKIQSLDTKIESGAFDSVDTVTKLYVPKGFVLSEDLWGISNPEDVEVIKE